MKYHDLTLGQIEAIVNKHGGIEGVKQFLEGRTTIERVIQCFEVKMPHEGNIESTIKLANFDTSDLNPKRFGIHAYHVFQPHEQKIYLLDFGERINSKKAVEKIMEKGFRPAHSVHLIGLAINYPGLQLQFPIVALGSLPRNEAGEMVSVISRIGNKKRYLFQKSFYCSWSDQHRFAAVRLNG